MYPGGAPISFAYSCGSAYSLQSMRIIALGSSNRLRASAFASSVLPVPVRPTSKNVPIGLLGRFRPTAAFLTARVSELIASSCPMICALSERSRLFTRRNSCWRAASLPGRASNGSFACAFSALAPPGEGMLTWWISSDGFTSMQIW